MNLYLVISNSGQGSAVFDNEDHAYREVCDFMCDWYSRPGYPAFQEFYAVYQTKNYKAAYQKAIDLGLTPRHDVQELVLNRSNFVQDPT